MKSKCTVVFLFAVLFSAQAYGAATWLDENGQPSGRSTRLDPHGNPLPDEDDAIQLQQPDPETKVRGMSCDDLDQAKKKMQSEGASGSPGGPPDDGSLAATADKTKSDFKKLVEQEHKTKKCGEGK